MYMLGLGGHGGVDDGGVSDCESRAHVPARESTVLTSARSCWLAVASRRPPSV